MKGQNNGGFCWGDDKFGGICCLYGEDEGFSQTGDKSGGLS